VNQAGPTTQRLFFALWPDPEVRRQLADASGRWSKKPVAEDKLHITLIFLGEQSPQQRDCCCQAASTVHGEAFELRLDFLGFWPRPGIQWLGSSDIPAALPDLVERLQAALQPCGYRAEKRPFVPHVTFARRVRKAPVKTGLEAICWPVSDYALVESVVTEGRASYRVLQRWPLGNSA
jgi:2'-5' RNA ligase